MAELLFPQSVDPENMDGDDFLREADHADPSRRLFLERHVTNIEKSAFGSHPLPRMDEYPHGTEYFSPNLLGSSRGETHLAPPLLRYTSSSGSIGGDESCLSEPSWTNSQFCMSPDQTPLPSPMPSPSNYPEPLGSNSPMIGTMGALFQGDGVVLPQDLHHYPDTLDISPQCTGAPRSVPYAQVEPSVMTPLVDPALEEPLYEANQPPRKRSRQSQSITHSSSLDSSPSQPSVDWCSGFTTSSDTNTTIPEKTQLSRTNSRNSEKKSPRNKRTSPQGRHSTNGVIFPCTFAHFGCPQTFTAKNEWKRHVATIHLQLGVYICDIGYCNHSLSGSSPQGIPYPPPSPKTYNRKDLFTQHLKRMHASPHNSKTKLSADEESALDAFTRTTSERCFVQQRPAPSYSECPYCPADFAGAEIWDERIEHVARHIEAGERAVREDRGLKEWAVREGIVVEQNGGKGYVLVERVGGRKRKA